jgi:hypothetical protein
MKRLLLEAKLKISAASIEDIAYGSNRDLDRAQIRQLATCRWIEEHTNVALTGQRAWTRLTSPAHSASGPAARATVLCTAALRGSSTSSRSLPPTAPTSAPLLSSLASTCSSSTISASRLSATPSETTCSNSSTIAAARAPPSSLASFLRPKWHEYLHDPSIADTICDRLLHTAHRVAQRDRRKERTRADSRRQARTERRAVAVRDFVTPKRPAGPCAAIPMGAFLRGRQRARPGAADAGHSPRCFSLARVTAWTIGRFSSTYAPKASRTTSTSVAFPSADLTSRSWSSSGCGSRKFVSTIFSP